MKFRNRKNENLTIKKNLSELRFCHGLIEKPSFESPTDKSNLVNFHFIKAFLKSYIMRNI